MDLKQSQQLRKYVDIVYRRKALIFATLLLSIAIGLAMTAIIPKSYRATALLSYQEQKVNPARMSPDVQEKVREMVSTLSQIVTSRTNLENVIKQFNLYGVDRNKMPMEDVVDRMRKNIEIKTSPSGDTFRISFQASVPGDVVKVTNSLASKFIEENLRYREERATETSSYTKNELQMAKVVLDKKEDAMREYKLKYYNEMPDQRESNLAQLVALQQQAQTKQSNIQDLERTKVMLQEQINTRKSILYAQKTAASSDALQLNSRENGLPGETDAQRLERMRALYSSLLLKYTDKHPEVIRVQRIIEKLEKTVGSGAGGATGKKGAGVELDPILYELTMQMKKLEIDSANLNTEKQHTNTLIKKYQDWVSEAPNREAEWAAITREYGELKKHYDFLVAQDLQADSVMHLEQKQKGSQFKIEDGARMPEKPVWPDFYKIMGVAIGLGLISGCGLALGEAFLDSSFKDMEDVEGTLGIPVVCSIPFIYTEKETRREKRISLMWSIAFSLCVVMLGIAFVYCWQHGQIILKLGEGNLNV
ncbi:MAG: Wzz/FepE/Etk N-terminal domain-containing protein [Desulfocapsaceae bacterium]|nr:Wzz/FepE/Etk N-terminal domain-containing protein [Desulfocapsaceae bacterium]